MNRESVLEKISLNPIWDIIVIGGGASGLGIALDAASRGYSTILVEQADFAKSTSSKSTKLVHGGVRYLAQGNLSLVREATVERGLLSQNAPHLVKNQTFIIPVYNRWSRLKYTLGLKLYDWIAGRLSLGSSVFISRKKVLEKLPGIVSKKLFGGVLYHDGQFDDARLAINLAQSICDAGGFAINYMRVIGLIKENGKIEGVTATDMETNARYIIKAKAVINATGVFVDSIIKLDEPQMKKNIAVSQGVHLVIDKSFLPGVDAMLIPETSDGRVLFIVPWHDKLLMGTTDTPVKNITLEPIALEEEIRFILQTAGGYLTHPPKRKDVLSVFAGLRPLAAMNESDKKTKEISRGHKIIVSKSGLFSIIGGKWTTYRKMGEDMMDRVEKELQWKHIPSTTGSLAIHGHTNEVNRGNPLYFYGSDSNFILQLMEETKHEWISKKMHLYLAQVIWAIRAEMARTVEDVLSRRTRCLLLDAEESIKIAPLVAKAMAREMNKNENWIKEQEENYRDVADNYVIKSK
jgi:glycerol-3-phosphate dehydrogenase